MRQARTYAHGIGLTAVFLMAGCATAERARDPRQPGHPAADAVRRAITARIDRTVEATKRLDIDALARTARR